MKANDAPEKLYLLQHNGLICYCMSNEDDIEYTRTDAFIEQVEKYLQEHLIDYWSQSVTDESKFIEDFKNYIKGE